MKRSEKFFLKIRPYIFPFFILIGGLIATYYWLFMSLDFENNIDRSLALIISVAGLIFGVFQVVLNLNIQSARSKTQLRHSEYKELVKILNSISELLNEHMMNELNIHGLLTSFLNRENEYISFMNINNDYLFPGIQKSKVALDTLEELDKIHICIDKFRIKLEEIEKKKALLNYTDPIEPDPVKIIMQMNWHNEVRDNLKKYAELKFKLLKEIQSYL